jgi:hypothetical protein
MDKVDATDADKSDWIKLEFLMDPDNPALISKYSRQFALFKDGCPEDCIKWVTIPFVSKVKKMEKLDGTNTDKAEWIKLEFLMDPENPT